MCTGSVTTDGHLITSRIQENADTTTDDATVSDYHDIDYTITTTHAAENNEAITYIITTPTTSTGEKTLPAAGSGVPVKLIVGAVCGGVVGLVLLSILIFLLLLALVHHVRKLKRAGNGQQTEVGVTQEVNIATLIVAMKQNETYIPVIPTKDNIAYFHHKYNLKNESKLSGSNIPFSAGSLPAECTYEN